MLIHIFSQWKISLILAMIALLFALGFCSGPKSCYYGMRDNSNTNTPGEEYKVENCRSQAME